MKNLKVWIIAGIGAGSSLLIFMMIIIMIIFNVNLNSSCDDSEDSGDSPSTAGTAGEWTKKGSTAYNNAKAIFDSWVKVGSSGAAASGVVGWVNTEGGFSIIDRAEGHFGNDEKSSGISEGVMPTPSGNYGVGGGGVYQFTPFTKFAPLSDKKWLDMNAQTKFVFESIKKGDWIAKHDLTGGHHSVKEFLHETDPKKATLEWNAYERAGTLDRNRKQADAQKAYEMFGGASISANDSIIGGALSGADAGEQAQSDEESVNCGDDSTSVPGSWVWPFKSVPKEGPKLVPGQTFGDSTGFQRQNNFHDGIDFGDATYNGDIHAVHGGKISKIVKPGEYGISFYLIWETTDDGYGIAYQEFGNMDDIFVKEGDTVNTGDKIGVSRPGGDYSHLHLGISKEKDLGKALGKSFTDDGTWLNPVDVIKKGLENSGAGD